MHRHFLLEQMALPQYQHSQEAVDADPKESLGP
jgi:hypothetical protein